MPPLFLIVIACAIIAIDIASAREDTCSDEIARLEALVDRSLGNPAAKPMRAQSTDAQLNHQPTPETVRRAEESAQLRLAAILARAKILNADGKIPECIKSVVEAKRLLGIN